MKIGLLDLLGLMFIGLKLGDEIHWSWWYVLSPIIISFIFNIVEAMLDMIIKHKNKELKKERLKNSNGLFFNRLNQVREKAEERRKQVT